MADIKGESKKLTAKRMEFKLAEFQFQLSRLEVRKLELEHEQDVLAENEKALRATIANQRNEIENFNK